MPKCCVRHCKVISGQQIRTFGFPPKTDEERYKKWLTFICATQGSDWVPNEHSRICQLHFDVSSYIGARRLNVNAVPQHYYPVSPILPCNENSATSSKKFKQLVLSTGEIIEIEDVMPTQAKSRKLEGDVSLTTNTEEREVNTKRFLPRILGRRPRPVVKAVEATAAKILASLLCTDPPPNTANSSTATKTAASQNLTQQAQATKVKKSTEKIFENVGISSNISSSKVGNNSKTDISSNTVKNKSSILISNINKNAKITPSINVKSKSSETSNSLIGKNSIAPSINVKNKSSETSNDPIGKNSIAPSIDVKNKSSETSNSRISKNSNTAVRSKCKFIIHNSKPDLSSNINNISKATPSNITIPVQTSSGLCNKLKINNIFKPNLAGTNSIINNNSNAGTRVNVDNNSNVESSNIVTDTKIVAVISTSDVESCNNIVAVHKTSSMVNTPQENTEIDIDIESLVQSTETEKNENNVCKFYSGENRPTIHITRQCPCHLQIRRLQYLLRLETRKRRNVEMNIKKFLNDDQIKFLERNQVRYNPYPWSEKTLKECEDLRGIAGDFGYKHMTNKGWPLPSLRSIQRNVKLSQEDPTQRIKKPEVITLPSRRLPKKVKKRKLNKNSKERKQRRTKKKKKVDGYTARLNAIKQMESEASVKQIETEATVNQMELEACVNQVELETTVNRIELEASGNQVESEASVNQIELETTVNTIELEASVNQVESEASVNQMELEPIVIQMESEPSVNQMELEPSLNQMESEPSVNQMELEPSVNQMESELIINQMGLEPSVNEMESELTISVNQMELEPSVNLMESEPIVYQMELEPSVNQMTSEPIVNQVEIDECVVNNMIYDATNIIQLPPDNCINFNDIIIEICPDVYADPNIQYEFVTLTE